MTTHEEVLALRGKVVAALAGLPQDKRSLRVQEVEEGEVDVVVHASKKVFCDALTALRAAGCTINDSGLGMIVLNVFYQTASS